MLEKESPDLPIEIHRKQLLFTGDGKWAIKA
jgi:hypothetical protein